MSAICTECEKYYCLNSDFLCGICRDNIDGPKPLTDMLGQNINVGDYIVWPVTTGRAVGMSYGQVLEVGRNTASDRSRWPMKCKVQPISSAYKHHYWTGYSDRPDKKIKAVTIKKTENIVKIVKVVKVDVIDG